MKTGNYTKSLGKCDIYFDGVYMGESNRVWLRRRSISYHRTKDALDNTLVFIAWKSGLTSLRKIHIWANSK